MSGFNLPPGCSASDIPGNRPEDGAEETLAEAMAEAWSYGWDEAQVVALWREVVAGEEHKGEAQTLDRSDGL